MTTPLQGIPWTSASADDATVYIRNQNAAAESSANGQAADADLTTIAAIDATQSGVLASDGSGWFRKTYAALKTAMSFVKGDVGLGNVDNTSDAGKPVSTATQTALDAKSNAPSEASSVQTSNFNAAADKIYRIDTTSGSITATLPTAPADKTRIIFKHIIQGGTNTVTIACGGSDVFNKTGGSTSKTLPLLNQAIWVQYSLTNGLWTVIADDLALASLDGRYMAYAIHGSDASYARPATTGPVTWIGTATPSNATNNDIIITPSS